MHSYNNLFFAGCGAASEGETSTRTEGREGRNNTYLLTLLPGGGYIQSR